VGEQVWSQAQLTQRHRAKGEKRCPGGYCQRRGGPSSVVIQGLGNLTQEVTKKGHERAKKKQGSVEGQAGGPKGSLGGEGSTL